MSLFDFRGTNAKKYCSVIKNLDTMKRFCRRGEGTDLELFSCFTSIDDIFLKWTLQTLGSYYVTLTCSY